MKIFAILVLMIASVEACAVDPALSTNDTAFVQELKARRVGMPVNTDQPLPSYLKEAEALSNSNYMPRIIFRLFDSEGREEPLIHSPSTNIVMLGGEFRTSLHSAMRLIAEAKDLDYQLDETKREIIFKRKK